MANELFVLAIDPKPSMYSINPNQLGFGRLLPIGSDELAGRTKNKYPQLISKSIGNKTDLDLGFAGTWLADKK